MVWIIYKAYINGVFGEAEEQTNGTATDGGDVEQQRVDKCAEVVMDKCPLHDQSRAEG